MTGVEVDEANCEVRSPRINNRLIPILNNVWEITYYDYYDIDYIFLLQNNFNKFTISELYKVRR